MTRYFCDRCGVEITTKREHGRLKRSLYDKENYCNWQVEVMVARDNSWNSPLLCHRCVVDVVNRGTDVVR